MNVSRSRRRLIAARRYAARNYLPGQAPGPLWDIQGTSHDSPSALKLARNIAGRRYRTAMARMWRDHVKMYGPDDKNDCGGWTWDPPCGGCSRCIWAQTVYYAHGAEYARKAYWRNDLRLGPGKRKGPI